MPSFKLYVVFFMFFFLISSRQLKSVWEDDRITFIQLTSSNNTRKHPISAKLWLPRYCFSVTSFQDQVKFANGKNVVRTLYAVKTKENPIKTIQFESRESESNLIQFIINTKALIEKLGKIVKY